MKKLMCVLGVYEYPFITNYHPYSWVTNRSKCMNKYVYIWIRINNNNLMIVALICMNECMSSYNIH